MGTLKIVVYARHSTDKQNPASSSDQAAACAQLADRLGGEIVGTYIDEEISGYRRDRPGLLTMLNAVRGGGVDIVVAESFDRIARDAEDLAWIGKKLRFDRVRLHTVIEGEIDDVKLAVAAMLGSMFLSNLQTKTLRGMEAAVLAGRHAGGRAYGYRKVDRLDASGAAVCGLLEVNEGEARIVCRIFDEFASGRSAIQIAKGLNSDGVKGPRGKAWNASTIRGDPKKAVGLLNNALYRGELIWKKREWRKNPDLDARPRRYRMRDPAEWTRVAVPDLRIVTDDQWQAVRDEICARTRTTAAPPLAHARRRRHFLSGSIRCGLCGANYTISGKDYYRCAGVKERGTCSNAISVRKGPLEDAVLGLLQTRLLTPELAADFVSAFAAEVRAQAAEVDRKGKSAEARLAVVEKQLETLAFNMTLGPTSPTLLGVLFDLEREKRTLLSRPPVSRPPTKLPSPEEFLILFQRKICALRSLLADSRHNAETVRALSGLIHSIVIIPSDLPELEVTADVARLADFAIANENSPRLSLGGCSVSVVAGAGFEPATFRL